MTPEQAWADIERIEVDETLVSEFDREIQFSILGFNLTRELASLRMASECAINLRYLIKHSHRGAIDDYIKYSLQREWTLLDEIDGNIANRGGEELPIESRMRRSIMRTFSQSVVDPADL